jgi:hypothetical protein
LKRLADQNLYEILEVPADAPPEKIRAACERARSLYGPGSLATYSLISPEEGALLASRVDEASTILLDPGARARYDATLQQGVGGERPSSVDAGRAPFPPVIPAVQPPPDPPAPPYDGPPVERPESRPGVLLGAAARAAGEPAEGRARPILLVREVSALTAESPRASAPPAVPAAATSAPAERPSRTPPPLPSPPAPRMPVLPEGAPWSGEVLRQVREARGVSLSQLAERTKVTRHHIENIEAERFGSLPAPVYLRGILLALARELRLDGQKVARSYLDRALGSRG